MYILKWFIHKLLFLKSLRLFFLALLLGLFIGCKSDDPCEDVECGPGDCVGGICDCPDGFSGVHCEIELCFGLECINGDCDPQTEDCNCNPNYYGESCDILCVNGEFANGDCNCLEGYEGITCETEIRNRYVGYWDVDEWTSTSQIDGSPVPGFVPGAIRFGKGYNILEVELYTSERYSGLMLISSDTRIVGQVTENTINFGDISQGTVYGSASLDKGILRIELYFFNPTTSFTEVARGTFTKH